MYLMQLLLYISLFFLIMVIQIGFYLDIWTLLKYNQHLHYNIKAHAAYENCTSFAFRGEVIIHDQVRKQKHGELRS